MAWVPGFEHDVFISYARVDDLTADPDPHQGWVSQFHRHLEIALSKKAGRLDAIKIWRDTRQIRGNQLFDQTIEDSIHNSAILVMLASHGYLASDYCRQELDCFYRKAQTDSAGLAAGDEYRIFHVLLNNLPRSNWPREVGRTSGFPFHDAADEDSDGEPVEPAGDRFRGCLRGLADAIFKTLTRLKERSSEGSPPKSEDRFSIYVADIADTLAPVRRRLVNELKAAPDLNVLGAIPPPFESAAHDQRVRTAIQDADLSVHLLDIYPGREMEGSEGAFYPRRQVELALEHGREQFLWMPPGRTVDPAEDPEYAGFLQRLETGPREQGSYVFSRDLPSALSRQIQTRMAEIQARRAAAAARPPAALLDTHVKDQMYALELSQYLLRNNFQPYINPQEDDPERNLDLFTDRLKQVGLLILFYGAVAEEWVRSRLAVAIQIAIAENCPLRACGVYVAPPHKQGGADRLRLPLVPIEWMDHTKGFNARAVDHLLSRARAAGAAQ